MRYNIGDTVRSAFHGATGKVIDRLTWNEIVLVAFDDRPGLPIWIDVRLIEHVGAMTFTLDEPTNYAQRIAWCQYLVPIYQGGDRQFYCTPQILVSSYVAWDCELFPVEPPTPTTVEADDDGAITCELPTYAWNRYGAGGRWDNVFDWRWPCVKWYLVGHGRLAGVNAAAVTL